MNELRHKAAEYQLTIDSFAGLSRRLRPPEGYWKSMNNMSTADAPVLRTRDPRGEALMRAGSDGKIKTPAVMGTLADAVECGDALVLACAEGWLQTMRKTPDGQEPREEPGVKIIDNGYDLYRLSVPGKIRQAITFGRGLYLSPAGIHLNEDLRVIGRGNIAYTGALTAEQRTVDGTPRTVFKPMNGGISGILTGAQVEITDAEDMEGEVYYSGTCLGLDETGAMICTDVQTPDILPESCCVICPDLAPVCDYVCEHDNRIFGCRYGLNLQGAFVNEIYASALGEPCAWAVYEGLSTDSWTAGVGAQGAWTGAIELENYVVFFKEKCVYLVSGNGPDNYGYTKLRADGVQAGSEKSLCRIGSYLYYKSTRGIMRMGANSAPTCISDALGTDVWKNASGGTDGLRYFVRMETEEGQAEIYVYDTQTGSWTQDDAPETGDLFVNYKKGLFLIGTGEIPEGQSVPDNGYYVYDDAAAAKAKPLWKQYRTDPDGAAKYAADREAWEKRDARSKIFLRSADGLYYLKTEIMEEHPEISDPEDVPDSVAIALRDTLFLRYIETTQPHEIVYTELLPMGEYGILPAYTVTTDAGVCTVELLTAEIQRLQPAAWYVESGLLGLGTPNKKRIKEVAVRLQKEVDRLVRLQVAFDDETEWITFDTEQSGTMQTVRARMSPAKNCEGFRLRLSGEGCAAIYGIAIIYEDGGNGVY